jgi:hypothetical protein
VSCRSVTDRCSKPKAVFEILVTIDEECNFGSSRLAAMAAVTLVNANRAIPIPPERVKVLAYG